METTVWREFSRLSLEEQVMAGFFADDEAPVGELSLFASRLRSTPNDPRESTDWALRRYGGPALSTIHVVDDDVRRRARAARRIAAREVHAEVYESVSEFCEGGAHSGAILYGCEAGDPAAPAEVAALLNAGTGLPIAVYGEYVPVAQVVDLMNAGASDYLVWPFSDDALDRALRRLTTEGDHRCERARLHTEAKKRVEKLTGRETEVLLHLVQGLQTRPIGEALGISPRTVEIHRGNLMRKLEISSTAEAVRLALYAGLDPEASRFANL